MALRIEVPTFLVTFDTELLWGIRTMGWSTEDEVAAVQTRECVLPQVLGMLAELNIRATFALVGHLLIKPKEAPTLPSVGPPLPTSVDTWYQSIAQDFRRCPEGFHWPELSQLLKSAKLTHEIGLHSFTHWHFETPGTSAPMIEFEIETNRQLLRETGLAPSDSLVFPRNAVGGLDALSQIGIRSYRGPEENWYSRLPSVAGKLGHLWDCAFAMQPPVYDQLEMTQDILNIPGSYLFWSTQGLRKHIPMSRRVRQIKKGLQQATTQNALFHLWMHPSDLAHNSEVSLPALRQGLEYAAEMRNRDELCILTMSELRDRLR